MSDPVTNVEIEDVLSSIRRLVAEGDRVKQEKKREYGEVTAPADRLVLTPALRISEDGVETNDESSQETFVDAASTNETDVKNYDAQSARLDEFRAEAADFPDRNIDQSPAIDAHATLSEVVTAQVEPLVLRNEESKNSRESLEATIAALEAAVEGEPDDFEPDGSEVKPTSSWETSGFAGFNSRRDDSVDDVALDAPSKLDEILPRGIEQASEQDFSTQAQTSQVSELQQPIDVPVDLEPSDIADEIERTNSKAEAPAVLKPESRVFRVVPESAPEEDVQNSTPNVETSEMTADVAQTESENVEKSESARSNSGQEIHQEDDFGDDMAGGEIRPLAADDDIEVALDDDMFMDEEMLRNVVSEVLKGELEGKLGDTITRNVRKLVRREIHRVLTHQELE